jgi:SWI/SNF chromatin-remodeling complex subunit SWI1
MQDQQKKLHMSQSQGSLVEQQFAASSGLPRQNVGMPNIQQPGMRPMSSNGVPPQSMPSTNGMGQFMQMGNQQRPPLTSNDSRSSITPSDLDTFPHDANLLDQDTQGIKRKHDSDGVDTKRVRQKTDPPDGHPVCIQ